jgi:hypothetical protein
MNNPIRFTMKYEDSDYTTARQCLNLAEKCLEILHKEHRENVILRLRAQGVPETTSEDEIKK